MTNPSNTIAKIIKPSQDRPRLYCQQDPVPSLSDQNKILYSILISLKYKNQTYSHRIYDEEISELLERCHFLIDEDHCNFYESHKYLSKYLRKKSKVNVSYLIYDLISNNPIPDIEALYSQLESHSEDSEAFHHPSLEEMDEVDAVIYANACFVCKYMRQLYQLSNPSYHCTDAIPVFESHNTSTTSTGRGHADICWTYTTLRLTYRPYVSREEQAAEPWRISIKEEKTNTSDSKTLESPKEQKMHKNITLNLSTEDFQMLIRKILRAHAQNVLEKTIT